MLFGVFKSKNQIVNLFLLGTYLKKNIILLFLTMTALFFVGCGGSGGLNIKTITISEAKSIVRNEHILLLMKANTKTYSRTKSNLGKNFHRGYEVKNEIDCSKLGFTTTTYENVNLSDDGRNCTYNDYSAQNDKSYEGSQYYIMIVD